MTKSTFRRFPVAKTNITRGSGVLVAALIFGLMTSCSDSSDNGLPAETMPDELLVKLAVFQHLIPHAVRPEDVAAYEAFYVGLTEDELKLGGDKLKAQIPIKSADEATVKGVASGTAFSG